MNKHILIPFGLGLVAAVIAGVCVRVTQSMYYAPVGQASQVAAAMAREACRQKYGLSRYLLEMGAWFVMVAIVARVVLSRSSNVTSSQS